MEKHTGYNTKLCCIHGPVCAHTPEIIPYGGLGDDKPNVRSLKPMGHIISFYLSVELLLWISNPHDMRCRTFLLYIG